MLLLYIMIIIILYSYARPYKTRIVNYLEIGLLIILITVLKLRISPFLQDTVGLNVNHQNDTSFPACDDSGDGITVLTLAVILNFVYNIPIVVGLICLLVQIGLIM